MRDLGLRGLCAVLLSYGALVVLPAVASASDTFADASRPNDSGDCLTPATACRTINAAVAKTTPGSTVRVEPGTYAENVTLSGGVSLAAAAGTPTISPAVGPGVTVTGGPAVTVSGLTFSSAADGPELVLTDDAGSAIVTGNSFTDQTPGDANTAVGITTTSTGAPEISGNEFTLLVDAVQVLPPAGGAPGRPEITANTINVPDFSTGVTIESNLSAAVTGATTANLTGNLIQEVGDQTDGVGLSDRGSPANPGAGVTLVRNRILGGGIGFSDFGARAPVSVFGDVIGGQSAISAFKNGSFGGGLTVTNADLVGAIQLSGIDLTLDSSIATAPISRNPNLPSDCTITFSAGPTTSGTPCQSFQTTVPARFLDPANSDFHLNPALDLGLIDHGNPAPPPDGAIDIDGDPRAIDGDGACQLNPVRDIGADEFNPGIPDCATPPPPPPPPPPPGPPSAAPSKTGTGQRAAALKRCKHKHGRARSRCMRRARRLPL